MTTAPPAAISSLILTLSADASAEAAALRALAAYPGLEIGDYQRPWLPAVLDSATPKDDCAHIQALPGVVFIEVTFVEVPDGAPLPSLP